MDETACLARGLQKILAPEFAGVTEDSWTVGVKTACCRWLHRNIQAGILCALNTTDESFVSSMVVAGFGVLMSGIVPRD